MDKGKFGDATPSTDKFEVRCFPVCPTQSFHVRNVFFIEVCSPTPRLTALL